MNETLTSLVRRVYIVEEITKDWNRMQQELTTITTEVAAVRELLRALTTLMESISTRLDTVGETEPPPEESIDPEAVRLSRAWDFDDSRVCQHYRWRNWLRFLRWPVRKRTLPL